MPHIDVSNWFVATIGVLVFMVLFMVVIECIFVYKSCKSFQGTQKLTRLSLFTMLCGIIASIMDVYHTIHSREHSYLYLSNDNYTDLILFKTFFYFVSFLCVYLILVLRAHVAFKNSIYHLSGGDRLFLTILFIMLLLVEIGVLSTIYLHRYVNDTNFDQSSTILCITVVCLIVYIIADLLINILVLKIFLSKLYQIIYSLDQLPLSPNIGPQTHDSSNYNSKQNATLSQLNEVSSEVLLGEQQIEMLQLITKISVLTIFAIIFNLFSLGIQILISNALNSDRIDEKYINIILLIGFINRAIQSLRNHVILYLMFAFSKNEYYYCCKLCHYCLYKWCLEQKIKSKIRKARQKEIASDYVLLDVQQKTVVS